MQLIGDQLYLVCLLAMRPIRNYDAPGLALFGMQLQAGGGNSSIWHAAASWWGISSTSPIWHAADTGGT